jgi:catechol 2,3-dioxygenase-like lactoylglutathione lyase family enzyme
LAIPSEADMLSRMVGAPTLRVARASRDLSALLRFYECGLGLAVLGRFYDHQGFDGVILGREGLPYHLEFTHAHGHAAGRAPTADNLLVFYIPDANEWQDAVERMRDAGFDPVASVNPYWNKLGLTFEDPDGYRVVLQRSAWP